MKRNSSSFVFFTVCVVSFFFLTILAYGDVTCSGDVDPANPNDWDQYTHAYIGRTGTGFLSITNGGDVASGIGYIGYHSGSQGSVTVDGVGSSWIIGGGGSNLNPDNLYVGGYGGSGSLLISNGGMVTVADETIIAARGGTGTINFDGGSLTTKSLLAGSQDLKGTGTINTKGLVADVDLVFDSTHQLSQTFVMNNSSEQNITINLDVDGSGPLGVGYAGSGSMSIKEGARVASTYSYIGYHPGSQGSVTVDGVGSSWIIGGGSNLNSDNLYVSGYGGSGSVSITNGAMVTVAGETIMSAGGGTGIINFDGGSLTTESLLAGSQDLKGTGTINTNALVADVDLVFDSAHGLSQTFAMNNSSDQNITINLDVNGSGSLGAGYSGSGSINIAEGAKIASRNGYVGYKAGSHGSVIVDGIGSSWDSTWFAVGVYGSGSVSITNGGNITSCCGRIGDFSGSQGIAVVDGIGSSWNSGELYFGTYGGTGSLLITNGGNVTSNYSLIGNSFDSVGSLVVDGVGSSCQIFGRLDVGREGNGSVSITNGGMVTNDSAVIGGHTDSQGSVVVDGVGSRWESLGRISVGRSGSGSLSITNGGIVIVNRNLIIDTDLNGESFIEISTGGMLALKGDADSSITEFLALVDGSDEIRFWDESINDWSNIMNASIGEDFTLEYISDVNDDLYDHTVLTVPEPVTMVLFALGCLEIRRRRLKNF